MTRRLFQKQEYWVIVAILAFTPASYAQNTTTMTLTGTGNSTVAGDIYIDPYTATVGTASKVTVICDDWSNNSYVGESWTANVTNATAVGTASPAPMFGSNQTLYNEVAWLSSQILVNYSSKPTAAQQAAETELSIALWELTYGANQTNEETPSPLAFLAENLQGGTSNAEYQAALSDYCLAAGGSAALCSGTSYSGDNNSAAANYNAAGWEILTPAGNVNPSSDGTPQEFVVYTPESSALVLFGADMLGLLALAFIFRKRLLVRFS